MARQERANVDYFPHECVHGKKMFIIQEKYGNDGYAIWFKLLEELGKSDHHFIDLRDEENLEYLSAVFRVPVEKTLEILSDLSKRNAFHKELWNEHKIIFSEKFVESIKDAYVRRKNKCMHLLDLCKHLSISIGVNVDRNPLKPNINTQRIGEDRKGNKIKEDQIKEYDQFLSDFISKPNKAWIEELEKEFPSIDLPRTLVKFHDYWIQDLPKKKKLKANKDPKSINWKLTFRNTLHDDWKCVLKPVSSYQMVTKKTDDQLVAEIMEESQK